MEQDLGFEKIVVMDELKDIGLQPVDERKKRLMSLKEGGVVCMNLETHGFSARLFFIYERIEGPDHVSMILTKLVEWACHEL
jgi:hypothetical protein